MLMLVYLLGPEGLLSTLERLGYPTEPRAAGPHGRVLPGPHRARLHPQPGGARQRAGTGWSPGRGWATFREALAADLDDTQGGTTQEGIHLGAMAGTIDIITRAFAGYRTEGDRVILTRDCRTDWAPHASGSSTEANAST
ncbi:hypothetical protein BJF82_16650 [Kytococcus sp. CUA-901]|nr:hypothetical protein BJF82_16650 [Kytococcus sp. CUA-901]